MNPQPMMPTMRANRRIQVFVRHFGQQECCPYIVSLCPLRLCGEMLLGILAIQYLFFVVNRFYPAKYHRLNMSLCGFRLKTDKQLHLRRIFRELSDTRCVYYIRMTNYQEHGTMTEDQNKQKNEWREEFEVKGRDLVERVKELIREGNVRKLIIYKSDGDVLMEVPLTASVIAGSAMLVLTPILAAIGAAAAFLAEVKIEVVRMTELEVDEQKRKNLDGGNKEKIDID
jgi:hypothetical protein